MASRNRKLSRRSVARIARERVGAEPTGSMSEKLKKEYEKILHELSVERGLVAATREAPKKEVVEGELIEEEKPSTEIVIYPGIETLTEQSLTFGAVDTKREFTREALLERLKARQQTKLNPATVERLYKLVIKGSPLYIAADVVGVSAATLYKWLKRGKKLVESKPKKMTSREELCAVLYNELMQASGSYVAALNDKIHDRTHDDWFRVFKILERRDPRTWGKDLEKGDDEVEHDPDESFM